jgi:hypothetical protein
MSIEMMFEANSQGAVEHQDTVPGCYMRKISISPIIFGFKKMNNGDIPIKISEHDFGI